MQADTILTKRLETFCDQNKVDSKGSLSVMLVITRNASFDHPPFNPNEYLTSRGGQVSGLGRTSVQSILSEHGITRILAEEGGRTSRGSIQKMRTYIQFLNELEQENILDFKLIEKWWINRVIKYFESKPFKLRIDPSKSLYYAIDELITNTFTRQKECQGMMVAGAVLEHLVGAKLEIALPDLDVQHKGFSVADSPRGGKGDFLIGDSVIHVTTAPSEALIRKCSKNLEENLHPIIITTVSGMGGATANAANAGIADRIEILEIVQFVTTNVYEWSQFSQTMRTIKLDKLIEKYNCIIEKCETDPSLKISIRN